MGKKNLPHAVNCQVAGLLFESTYLFLDHLAPLCSLMKWPLIIVEPTVRELAERFYPDLTLIESSMTELRQTIQPFTHLVTGASRPLLTASLGPISKATIWLPHGNSDKGRIFPFFEALRNEELVLIYGQKMADFLKDEQVSSPCIRIGQYRYLYYHKWQSFYDSLPIVKFSQQQSTILYAPTWEDSENNCSFWNAFPQLAEQLPASLNLIVKLHPNTIEKHAPKIERLIGKFESSHLQFLIDFPPIIPLLSRCDYYLGDRSSIGYDFLRFDRPLFFINPHDHKKGRDLLACGMQVTPDTFYQSLLHENHARFSPMRREMNAYTFDEVSLSDLKHSIMAFCRQAQRRHDKNSLQIH